MEEVGLGREMEVVVVVWEGVGWVVAVWFYHSPPPTTPTVIRIQTTAS